jgi:hypothetical protein
MGYVPREWRELHKLLKTILGFSKWGGCNSSRRAHHLEEREERGGNKCKKREWR